MSKKAFLLAFATIASASYALAQTRNSTTGISMVSDAKVIVALIAFIGVVISAIVSFVLARLTAKNTVKNEQAKRQSELALKIAELISSGDNGAQRTAMRRYAVGIVKIVGPEHHPQAGLVYFIPMNSRITVGRSLDNDIVLQDEDNSVSRWHCGFIFDQHSVWIDDYKSTNGTVVGNKKIVGSRLLDDNEEIQLPPYKLHFRRIRENTILSQ
jgi:hypothetical protein